MNNYTRALSCPNGSWVSILCGIPKWGLLKHLTYRWSVCFGALNKVDRYYRGSIMMWTSTGDYTSVVVSTRICPLPWLLSCSNSSFIFDGGAGHSLLLHPWQHWLAVAKSLKFPNNLKTSSCVFLLFWPYFLDNASEDCRANTQNSKV